MLRSQKLIESNIPSPDNYRPEHEICQVLMGIDDFEEYRRVEKNGRE